MKSTDGYRINEIFYSLQGEGFHTGTAAVFVRFAGCNLRCGFCDTDFTDFTVMSAAEITAAVKEYGATTVILTGGEPSLQVDAQLVEMLHGVSMRVHIETNGTHPLPDGIDWVTCSPKDAKVCLLSMDELKVVYQGQDLSQYDKYKCKCRFLQPCSNANVKETIEAVKQNPTWRLSLQTHIIIGIR